MEKIENIVNEQNSFLADYFCGYKSSMRHSHLHEHFEISICIKGALKVLINDNIWDVDGSCLLLLPANSVHKVLIDESRVYERYTIYFSKKSFYEFLPAYGYLLDIFNSKDLFIPIRPDNINNITYYMSQMISQKKEVQALLLALLLTEIKKISQLDFSIGKKSNSYINEVLLYITKNYGEKLSAENIAQNFYISRSKLTADFKKETGVTLNEYIISIRLKNAKQLLRSGCSVLETSLKTGFVNQNHFIYTFKKRYGITPSKICQIGKQYTTLRYDDHSSKKQEEMPNE